MREPDHSSGGAGISLPCDPLNRREWLAKLEKATDVASAGIALAWVLSRGFLSEVFPSAEPSQLADQKSRSGELFPLPGVMPDDLRCDGNAATTGERLRLAVRCWVAVGCASINALYTCPMANRGFCAGLEKCTSGR